MRRLRPGRDRVLIDATSAEFISVRGYRAIGELSKSVDRVTICSRSDLAAQVIDILGFPDVLCMVRQSNDPASLLLPDANDRRFWGSRTGRRLGDGMTSNALS